MGFSVMGSTVSALHKDRIWTGYEVSKNVTLWPPWDSGARRTGIVGPRTAGSPLRSVRMSDRSRKLAKPAAAFGLLATMASIWWFALRPRRKIKLDDSNE